MSFLKWPTLGSEFSLSLSFHNPLPLSTVENCDSPKNIGASRSRISESETKSKAYNAPHGALLFDQFWQEYPRKVGKEYALKCWKKISNGKGPQIIEAIKKQVAAKTHWRHPDGIDYIPNPSTWLNQGRWDDEITEQESPHAKGRPSLRPESSEMGDYHC